VLKKGPCRFLVFEGVAGVARPPARAVFLLLRYTLVRYTRSSLRDIWTGSLERALALLLSLLLSLIEDESVILILPSS